jgi:transcriptional regulator with XRE-family HTH domain
VVFGASIDHICHMAKRSPIYMESPSLIAIGKTIRTLRTELGVSQENLALNAGMDRSYVGGIERGEHNLTTINLIKIATALGIRASELLTKSGM